MIGSQRSKRLTAALQALSRASKRCGVFPYARAAYDLIPERLVDPEAPRLRARLGDLYARFVRPGELFFDVGAHSGIHTRVLRRLGARVVAFEPQPEFARYLQIVHRRDPEVEVLRAALGSAPGTATMYVGTDASRSTLSEDYIAREVTHIGKMDRSLWSREIQVPVLTLDGAIDRFGLPVFCKIDVEGFEEQVLNGLSRSVATVSFEFATEYLDYGGRCMRRLARIGDYRFNYSLAHDCRLALDEWLDGEACLASIRARPGRQWGDIFARLIAVQE